MKIAFARRGYSSTGGAEHYLRRFAEAAAAAGHSVRLYTEQWPAEAWPWETVAVRSSSPRGFADAVRNARAAAPDEFLFSLERLWTCDAYRAGDGVHQVWLERRAAFEPPWKSWLRGFNSKHRETLALERSLFSHRGAGAVIVNSQMVKGEIVETFGYPAERIHVVYNGAPRTTAPPDARAEVRRELGLDEAAYVLLFAGSGWFRKGLRFALDAIAALPAPATLLVAGRGSRRGLPATSRAVFLGPTSNLPRYFAAVDVFVLPTLYEPFSNACLEAASSGLPVITTRQNGFSEIMTAGAHGEVLESPSDRTALSAAMEAWRDPDRRRAAKSCLLQLGSKYTVEENLRRTMTALEDCFGQERQASDPQRQSGR